MRKNLRVIGTIGITLSAILLGGCESGRNPFLTYMHPVGWEYKKDEVVSTKELSQKDSSATREEITISNLTIKEDFPEPPENHEPPVYKLEKDEGIKTETPLKRSLNKKPYFLEPIESPSIKERSVKSNPTIEPYLPELPEIYELHVSPLERVERDKGIKTKVSLEISLELNPHFPEPVEQKPYLESIKEPVRCPPLSELNLNVEETAIKATGGLTISCLWKRIKRYKTLKYLEIYPLDEFINAFKILNSDGSPEDILKRFIGNETLKAGEIYSLLIGDFDERD